LRLQLWLYQSEEALEFSGFFIADDYGYEATHFSAVDERGAWHEMNPCRESLF
jgi:hypothetical protein